MDHFGNIRILKLILFLKGLTLTVGPLLQPAMAWAPDSQSSVTTPPSPQALQWVTTPPSTQALETSPPQLHWVTSHTHTRVTDEHYSTVVNTPSDTTSCTSAASHSRTTSDLVTVQSNSHSTFTPDFEQMPPISLLSVSPTTAASPSIFESHKSNTMGSESHTASTSGSESHTASTSESESHTASTSGPESHKASTLGSESHTASTSGSESHTASTTGSESHTASTTGSESHTANTLVFESHTGSTSVSTSVRGSLTKALVSPSHSRGSVLLSLSHSHPLSSPSAFVLIPSLSESRAQSLTVNSSTPTTPSPEGIPPQYRLILYIVPPLVAVVCCLLCLTLCLCLKRYKRKRRYRRGLIPLTDRDGSDESEEEEELDDREPAFMVTPMSRPMLAFADT